MSAQIERVKTALQELKKGKMILLTDDPGRENEGDLVVAAEKITPEIMNFMIRHGTGIICVPMAAQQLHQLNLAQMVPSAENTCSRNTQFTVSVDAKNGIATGVSAADRVRTVQALINDSAQPEDLVKPGHVFPLAAKDGGALERQGHTEGAIDLMKLANLKPAAVLCEVMNADGTMARGKKLDQFAGKHKLFMLTIDDIITYRLYHENLIAQEVAARFPLEKYGMFEIKVVREKITGVEHVVLYKKIKPSAKSLLVRIHSSCLTGDLFVSERCDCNKQLHYSLQRISEEGGMLIYLNQEGRGIGLFNKIRAYALQEQGYDTVEANLALGLPVDCRKYHIAANILRNDNVKRVRLLTNNPDKLNDLKKYGIGSVVIEPMPAFDHVHNHFYLQTKKEKLRHMNGGQACVAALLLTAADCP